ncbi:hypothetical protein R5R35_001860 [Gryllus longicercus]|uniref:Uncharacterized protein n=1 Tax=Gryllus longicercus TaxID=2509291 RepID=A0AAN9VLA3_9ORTH
MTAQQTTVIFRTEYTRHILPRLPHAGSPCAVYLQYLPHECCARCMKLHNIQDPSPPARHNASRLEPPGSSIFIGGRSAARAIACRNACRSAGRTPTGSLLTLRPHAGPGPRRASPPLTTVRPRRARRRTCRRHHPPATPSDVPGS